MRPEESTCSRRPELPATPSGLDGPPSLSYLGTVFLSLQRRLTPRPTPPVTSWTAPALPLPTPPTPAPVQEVAVSSEPWEHQNPGLSRAPRRPPGPGHYTEPLAPPQGLLDGVWPRGPLGKSPGPHPLCLTAPALCAGLAHALPAAGAAVCR